MINTRKTIGKSFVICMMICGMTDSYAQSAKTASTKAGSLKSYFAYIGHLYGAE